MAQITQILTVNSIAYIAIGVLPSVIWLLYYLRKDVHPESNRMVLKIFFYGILIVVPAALIEIGIEKGLNKLNLPFAFFIIVEGFLGVALIEELAKYLVVRHWVLRHPEFDEPVDVMLYMIISALGFAAAENIMLFLGRQGIFYWSQTLNLAIGRFITTTFLHALVSGFFGYFLALAIFDRKKQKRYLFTGLIIATLLHGLYNFSIISNGSLRIIIPAVILISLAFFVSLGLKDLRGIKSVCKIN